MLYEVITEKNAIGTGIGTLMPTMPMLTSLAKRRAAPPDSVKIAAPLAYGLAFTSAIASSSVFARSTTSTRNNFV